MSKITYESVIKFPVSQRLFKGSDGRFYLADESADEIPYRGNQFKTIIGTPDKTDDGPLAILTDEPIEAYYDDRGFHQGFHVRVEAQVLVEVERGVLTSLTRVNVCIDGALYLSAHLGMRIKSAVSDSPFNVQEAPAVPTSATAILTIEIEFDPRITNAAEVGDAVDTLMETAMSTSDVLDGFGNPSIGQTYIQDPRVPLLMKYVSPEDKEITDDKEFLSTVSDRISDDLDFDRKS